MRGGVDSARQAADHGQSGVGKLIGELFGRLRSVVSRAPRADDSDGVMIALQSVRPRHRDTIGGA